MSLHERLTGPGPEPGDDERWAASGAMALTGDDQPAWAPAGLVPYLTAVERELCVATAELGTAVDLDAVALLGERAALLGLRRGGQTSCGGATRLLPARDDWLAVALPRPEDVDAVPAWLGVDDPLAVPVAVRTRPAAEVVADAALLGLPVSRRGEARPTTPVAGARQMSAGPPRPSLGGCIVLDLSALWAGPLCGHLLTLAGARVVKVESSRRLDGARGGPAAFFDLLHAGQESVVLDLPDERARLDRLTRAADVVIEASRPRALEQLGIDAAARASGGTVWVSITGYGRARGLRVAFGDDAAVAGGLVAGQPARPWFCADAVADPLAGLTAAVAVLDCLRAGGGWLIDVAMANVAAWCARGRPSEVPPPAAVAAPQARPPGGRAAPAGRDTLAVLRELNA